MSEKVQSFFSLRFLLQWLELPLYFLADLNNAIFVVGVHPRIDDPPLPKPEVIDHITQQGNLRIVILRRLVLLKRIVSPLNNIVDHPSRFHLDIVFVSVVDDGLLKGCCVLSSLAEFFDRFEGINLKLDLLGSCVLVVVLCYDPFGFLELVELKFLLLVLGLVFGYCCQELARLFDIHREESFVKGTVGSKLLVFLIEHLNLLRNCSIVKTISQRTHLIDFSI